MKTCCTGAEMRAAGVLCLAALLAVTGCAAGGSPAGMTGAAAAPDAAGQAGEGQETSMTADMELTKEFLDAHRTEIPAVTVHDPSIFQDRDGKYYIVGTHLTSARSDDLIRWEQTDASFKAAIDSDNMRQIRAYNDDLKAGSPVGYLWAPDLIYNETMGKYCVYLSANGDHWQSNIVLLTGDSPEGPFTYAGSVVYGGFTEDNWTETDVAEVLGLDPARDELPQRYILNGVKNDHWGDRFPNCIDPCVFFDEEGRLWMSYGSWSGGIFLLQLDPATGLRDLSVEYPTEKHSDAYFGTLIAGGSYVTGEGSFIKYMNGYYWLFLSYGELQAHGGYNIRVFRSEHPKGPYTDERGNGTFYDTYVQNVNFPTGERLFGAYRWNTDGDGMVSQGHNSVLADRDGRFYIVFHTRTTNGTEYHYVRIHQLFFNKNGWPVAAPYRTTGERLPDGGIDPARIAGTYDVILHRTELDHEHQELNTPETVTLHADGTVSGAYGGSWQAEAGTPYLTLDLTAAHDKESDVYAGVALEMTIDDTDLETAVFTALGEKNQLTLWGSKRPEE